ncbi:MAG: hypothetical protein E7582_03830 [Ruminococcaceae bacterium]|nr:hypothetical protein [Oscillospiraceae bacterium]
MKFKTSLENYPSAVVAIDKDGFVIAKNYLASISFPVIHVGAKVSNYTDINYLLSGMSRGVFCGKEYTYFCTESDVDKTPCYLMFLSLASFGEDLLPFDVIKAYGEKVEKFSDNCVYGEKVDSNAQRRYIRSVHNNLVKVNFFSVFKNLFNPDRNVEKMRLDDEKVVLSQICTSVSFAVDNYLSELDVVFDINYENPKLVAGICKQDIVNIILNTLVFCAINSSSSIKVSLDKGESDVAQLTFDFTSRFDLFSVYKVSEGDTSVLNSALSFFVAFELAKLYDFKFSFSKNREIKNRYKITYEIPVTTSNKAGFSSGDNLDTIVERYLFTVFFNEEF